MKLSLFGRLGMALFASLTLGLGMTACGGGTIGYMWILGQQYNQIAGFKIDDYTGNLTQIEGSPFITNGVMPVSIVVKQGGRYVYVINRGTCPAAGCGTGPNISQSVALYSVGGDGTLTFQQSYQTQGYNSMWAQMDASGGSYLYVLDKYSPSFNSVSGLYNGPNTDGNGAITVFAADSATGRLTLVTNSQTQHNGVNTPFFEVGPGPFMMKTAGNCLLTLNTGNTISPYVAGNGGQLAFATTQIFPIGGASNITSINGNGSYVFLTDAGADTIDGFTVATGCTLTTLQGGNTANITGQVNPMYTLVDSNSKYLYVLNQTNTLTLPGNSFSSISAFTINSSNQELQPITGAPYTVGAGPVCMVEDPTNQYMYISNHNDGTVTGKVFDPTTGILSSLKRGSTFTSSGLAGCLALSGAVD
jgi:6-phosphogluconolactonase (cycloisomerase 2 family)